MVKNLTANAGGNKGSIPGPGRSLGATKPMHPNYWSPPALKKPLQWEARVPHLESSPCCPQLEETQARQQDTVQPEKKKKSGQVAAACMSVPDPVTKSLIRWREIE